ncbi:MAG: TonB-dependent receptor [Acidobacteria bacterium 13_1_20CM_4_56_7]|nr:MAG: TonB-dependent receptor [Acidobacteria bacterium 13_1_20CM_4_56_7]
MCLLALPLAAQSTMGELHLRVTDPRGSGMKASVQIVSEANQYDSNFATDDSGVLVAKRLPFGFYDVRIEQPGFAPASASIEVRSAVPVEYSIKLNLPSVNTSVTVRATETLVDPHRSTSVNEIGEQTIQTRTTSLPGRSLQDLVNSQPGWTYEGNAVLHPRGTEYQTQFVLDGIPLTDNRSPGLGPEVEADDIDSLTVYTAGIPAEFGRKMGGVVEVNTLKDAAPGMHGQVVLSGGSFDTAGAFARVQYAWKASTVGASASGDMTSRYLNPVVPQNYTNRGTTGDFAARYERDLTAKDRIGLIVRHDLSRFQIPNEQIQQGAGQRQDGGNFETMGIASYQHVFSSDLLGSLRAMVRDNANDLTSNPQSTPVIAFLHNHFRETYFNGALSLHHGNHDFKAGFESDNTFLQESFNDRITDRTRFDPGTPLTFVFPGSIPSEGRRPELDQAAYIQDSIRSRNWTFSAGLRLDHYQLLVNQNALSPRLSAARFFPASGLVVHVSYDHVFQTPEAENILLASSPQVVSLNPSVLRLPVEPSRGNYYEIGVTKAVLGQLRLDGNYYRRYSNNYADDDQLLSTAVAFPIAFRKAIIYGAEGKLEMPHWGRFSGFVSYSYMVGNAWFPVTGGLFLGQDAVSAGTQLVGHFPDTQDQRNTVRTRARCRVSSRTWVAGGAQYGSGMPFEFTGTYDQALAQYGPAMVDRVDFALGRVRSSFVVDVSAGAELYRRDQWLTTLQADIQNLNNRLNVLDFGGLFSGNAIAPPRSYMLRLQTSF